MTGELDKSTVLADISFVVGDDGILTLEAPNVASETVGDDEILTMEAQSASIETVADMNSMFGLSECPPELALTAVEHTMTPRKKRKYKECLQYNVDLPEDRLFQTWKSLISQTTDVEYAVHTAQNMPKEQSLSIDSVSSPLTSTPPPSSSEQLSTRMVQNTHPLVKAGLISQDLADVLIVPSMAKQEKKVKKKAKVLTSEEVKLEIEEKERKKKEQEENKLKKEKEKQLKQIEKAITKAKKVEEMRIKKEMREKVKAEREKLREEKAKPKKKIKVAVVENLAPPCETLVVTSREVDKTQPDQ